MQYISYYPSPLGSILLAADETGIMGLWFEGAKYYAAGLFGAAKEKNTPVLERAKEWLSIYFSGREPDFLPPVHMSGTPFQLAVWEILKKIPYGKTVTYGEIAREVAGQKGILSMSGQAVGGLSVIPAQAVGGAVAHNPISIIIPCHRVVGANGSLTGYAGGMERKVELLALEGVDIRRFKIPTKGTAL